MKRVKLADFDDIIYRLFPTSFHKDKAKVVDKEDDTSYFFSDISPAIGFKKEWFVVVENTEDMDNLHKAFEEKVKKIRYEKR